MSTSTREEVERAVEESGALIRVADAAAAFQRELDDVYGDLGVWEQGLVFAEAEAAKRLEERFREHGELRSRNADAMREERRTAVHLQAVDAADAKNELAAAKRTVVAKYEESGRPLPVEDLPDVPTDRTFEYAGDLETAEELPERVALGGNARRVFALLESEEVAWEGDQGWHVEGAGVR